MFRVFLGPSNRRRSYQPPMRRTGIREAPTPNSGALASLIENAGEVPDWEGGGRSDFVFINPIITSFT